MIRAIIGVVVGYIATAILVIACFTALQLGLGTERVFKPGLYEPTMLFNITALGVSLVAAILGGFICVLISRSSKAVYALAGLFLVLGLFSAVLNNRKPDPGPRIGNITPMEAAEKNRQPDWYAFTIPFLGAVGVIIGGRLKARA